MFRSCRFQQIGPRRITIEHLGAKFAQRFDVVRIVIQYYGMHAVSQQHTASDLAETAKTGDDHAGILFVDHVCRAFVLRGILGQASGNHQQQRRGGHRKCNGQRQRFSPFEW
ncbi:hypothetical protein D3C78_1530650 [compost metagenome]